jgi:hypothetical protein
MKYLKTVIAVAICVAFLPLQAQNADYYSAPMPNNKGCFYLMYKPDSNFTDMIKYDRELNKNSFKPVIENYGERAILFEADSFTIEADRTTALYFKAKNGKREIFLKKYLNEETCWGKGGVVYINLSPKNKNTVGIFLANSNETQNKNCRGEVITVNVEAEYANATGTQPKSDLDKVAAGISVVQENKVLLIKVPREAITKFVALNFKLYSGKKEIKDFLNIKATESVLYINDLPKGKYKYIVEVYDGTLITEGTVTITKKK